MFHEFAVINRKTRETVITLTQIGRTRRDAARTIREHNLKGVDFKRKYKLVNPATTLLAEDLCFDGQRFGAQYSR